MNTDGSGDAARRVIFPGSKRTGMTVPRAVRCLSVSIRVQPWVNSGVRVKFISRRSQRQSDRQNASGWPWVKRRKKFQIVSALGKRFSPSRACRRRSAQPFARGEVLRSGKGLRRKSLTLLAATPEITAVRRAAWCSPISPAGRCSRRSPPRTAARCCCRRGLR